MKRMNSLTKFPHGPHVRGAAATEYGILAALISVLAIGTVVSLGDGIGGNFGTVSDQLSENVEAAENGDSAFSGGNGSAEGNLELAFDNPATYPSQSECEVIEYEGGTDRQILVPAAADCIYAEIGVDGGFGRPAVDGEMPPTPTTEDTFVRIFEGGSNPPNDRLLNVQGGQGDDIFVIDSLDFFDRHSSVFNFLVIYGMGGTNYLSFPSLASSDLESIGVDTLTYQLGGGAEATIEARGIDQVYFGVDDTVMNFSDIPEEAPGR